jgi:hypothetical protein
MLIRAAGHLLSWTVVYYTITQAMKGIIAANEYNIKKVKLSLLQATEAYRVVRCQDSHIIETKKNKQTPGPLVRKQTIPTDRPPLVGEITLCRQSIHIWRLGCLPYSSVAF